MGRGLRYVRISIPEYAIEYLENTRDVDAEESYRWCYEYGLSDGDVRYVKELVKKWMFCGIVGNPDEENGIVSSYMEHPLFGKPCRVIDCRFRDRKLAKRYARSLYKDLRKRDAELMEDIAYMLNN